MNHRGANYLNPKSEARNKCKVPILKFSKPARPVVSNFKFLTFGVNPFDYLMTLQQHAETVPKALTRWLPWNYLQTLETLDTG